MNNSIKLHAFIPIDFAGQRLDQAMAQLFPEYSRARLQQWVKQQHVSLDGKPCKQRDKVKGGEEIEIDAPPIEVVSWQAREIELDIIYEDDDIIAINKPPGLVVHPAAGHHDDTLVNALLHHCPTLNQLPRAGIVHRLDKDTSGLLVIAKTLTAHAHLVNQLQTRSMHRYYQAVVNSVIVSGGTINLPIDRHPKQRKKMAVIHTGKEAVTHYRVIKRFAAHTHIGVNLETGRTHQIRVHMTEKGYPLVGDQTYGGRLKLPKNASAELIDCLRKFKRQALHASELTLLHPATNEEITLSCELAPDIVTLLNKLAG